MARTARDSHTTTLATIITVALWESTALLLFASHRKHTTLIIPCTVPTHPIKDKMVLTCGRSLMNLMHTFQDSSGRHLPTLVCLITRLVRSPQL